MFCVQCRPEHDRIRHTHHSVDRIRIDQQIKNEHRSFYTGMKSFGQLNVYALQI